MSVAHRQMDVSFVISLIGPLNVKVNYHFVLIFINVYNIINTFNIIQNPGNLESIMSTRNSALIWFTRLPISTKPHWPSDPIIQPSTLIKNSTANSMIWKVKIQFAGGEWQQTKQLTLWLLFFYVNEYSPSAPPISGCSATKDNSLMEFQLFVYVLLFLLVSVFVF